MEDWVEVLGLCRPKPKDCIDLNYKPILLPIDGGLSEMGLALLAIEARVASYSLAKQ